MTDWHPNTLKLISIANEARSLGWNEMNPRKDFEEEVAKSAGEEGNDYPSDAAIRIAKAKLTRFKHYKEAATR